MGASLERAVYLRDCRLNSWTYCNNKFLNILLQCCLCGLELRSCPTGHFHSSSLGLCCKLCPARHFISRECHGPANDTQGSLCNCPSGTYMNAKENKDTKCHNCRTSCRDQKEIVVKNSSSIGDIQCECSDDYYRDQHSLQCKKCTSCIKKDQVLLSPFEKYKDAVCKTCDKVRQ